MLNILLNITCWADLVEKVHGYISLLFNDWTMQKSATA